MYVPFTKPWTVASVVCKDSFTKLQKEKFSGDRLMAMVDNKLVHHILPKFQAAYQNEKWSGAPSY
jgi:hypothetical protein